jgi:REP element-mobilizing transposase RayT
MRGIEGCRIVKDVIDREDFVRRLGDLATETDTIVYAWALMSNHAHILLRSAQIGLSNFMRRLLTGYALTYNRRHRRWGHLFQNRYKSIICDEDAYFTELVRYIHLNPLRAKRVGSLVQLDRYRWSGHSVLMGMQKHEWQDRDYVLTWFGKKEGEAVLGYREFVEKGIKRGRRPELVGGGLVRSSGGWSAVMARRRKGERELSDERILGSGEFVKRIVDEAEADRRYQFAFKDDPAKIDALIAKECQNEDVSIKALKAGSRQRKTSRLRARLAVCLVKTHGVSLAEAARQLGISTSAVSKIVTRSKRKST